MEFNFTVEFTFSFNQYGFHVAEEMHTKHFLTDKNPYRDYNWSKEIKQEILKAFTLTIAAMDLKIVNVVIDKTKFKDDNYHILENALKYNKIGRAHV